MVRSRAPRANVQPTVSMDAGKDGGAVMHIELPKGEYLPGEASAPPRLAARRASGRCPRQGRAARIGRAVAPDAERPDALRNERAVLAEHRESRVPPSCRSPSRRRRRSRRGPARPARRAPGRREPSRGLQRGRAAPRHPRRRRSTLAGHVRVDEPPVPPDERLAPAPAGPHRRASSTGRGSSPSARAWALRWRSASPGPRWRRPTTSSCATRSSKCSALPVAWAPVFWLRSPGRLGLLPPGSRVARGRRLLRGRGSARARGGTGDVAARARSCAPARTSTAALRSTAPSHHVDRDARSLGRLSGQRRRRRSRRTGRPPSPTAIARTRWPGTSTPSAERGPFRRRPTSTRRQSLSTARRRRRPGAPDGWVDRLAGPRRGAARQRRARRAASPVRSSPSAAPARSGAWGPTTRRSRAGSWRAAARARRASRGPKGGRSSRRGSGAAGRVARAPGPRRRGRRRRPQRRRRRGAGARGRERSRWRESTPRRTPTDPWVHRTEPRLEAAVLAAHTDGVLVVPAGRGAPDALGRVAAWIGAVGWSNTVGRTGSRAAIDIDVAAGAVGDDAAGFGRCSARALRSAGPGSACARTSPASCGAVARRRGAGRRRLHRARCASGPASGLHLAAHAAERDGVDPYVARALVDVPSRPPAASSRRPGWTGGARLGVPVGSRVTARGGADVDLDAPASSSPRSAPSSFTTPATASSSGRRRRTASAATASTRGSRSTSRRRVADAHSPLARGSQTVFWWAA